MSPAGSSNAPSEMAVTPGGNDDGFRIVNAVLALSETARSPPDARGIAADPQPGRRSSPHETPSRL